MHFEGTFNVKAPKEKVFGMMLDPNQISQCMPDLQKLEVKSPDDFTAVVKAGVSFIKGDFTLHFTTVEKTPPTHAKLVAHGTGIGSTVDLDTLMDIADAQGGGTSMKWSADAKIGGRIASVGQRLLNGQAEKIVKNLFECLQTKLEAA
ncbi:MAG TPA: carbon monoxide dehydrogenase subunit G [Nitrososphaerales archaeon]|nr:carbon monoxide dehydrogenase subunit G [Nitrososphaerales archaeon]